MDIKLITDYWQKLTDEKWETAKDLIKFSRRSDGLFFCHLAIECKLKELVVRATKNEAPRIHDLTALADMAEIKLEPARRENLNEISTFNIAGRYDDYKMKFYKRATPEYTDKFYKISKEILIWLSSIK